MVSVSLMHLIALTLVPHSIALLSPRIARPKVPTRLFAVEESAMVSEAPSPLGMGSDALLRKALSDADTAAFCTVASGALVYDAVRVMSSLGKGSVLVVDNHDVVAGIFTERDFVTKVIEQGRKSRDVIVDEVMTPASVLVTSGPDDTVGDALRVMAERQFRHLPVVKDGNLNVGEVQGVLSIEDLVKVMKDDDAELAGEYPLASMPSWAIPVSQQDAQDRERELANRLARKLGPQDTLRTAFVGIGAVVGAALLQGDWVHDHESLSLATVFSLGYAGIILEEQFGYNKAALGLLMCTALWVIYAGTAGATGVAVEGALRELSTHVSDVSEITFFLIGAMTIVEAVDAHKGFDLISEAISVRSKKKLFWIVSAIAFVMSGVLDNLTTTIVMVGLLKKLVPDPDDRKLFGALVVVAANAGGAWTPIGDVTTTMLWIGGQISVLPTMTSLVLPSLISTVVTTAVLASQLEETPEDPAELSGQGPTRVIRPVDGDEQGLAPRGKLVLATGVLGLLSVPLFKSLTGLPPYLGILSALGVMWVLTDTLHYGEGRENPELMVPAALRKIDTAGVLFFFGILLSVASLESAGILSTIANWLNDHISSQTLLAGAIGAASAVIDNVPLVAASMGMYDLTSHPMDDTLWQLIAYCAGTGGSMLVIGSAAGVALMGLEKVDFVWYAKNISVAAALGYLAGIGAYAATHLPL